MCDVCLQRHSSGLRQSEFDDIATEIRRQLASGPLFPDELRRRIDAPSDRFRQVLAFLLEQELIRREDSRIMLNA